MDRTVACLQRKKFRRRLYEFRIILMIALGSKFRDQVQTKSFVALLRINKTVLITLSADYRAWRIAFCLDVDFGGSDIAQCFSINFSMFIKFVFCILEIYFVFINWMNLSIYNVNLLINIRNSLIYIMNLLIYIMNSLVYIMN